MCLCGPLNCHYFCLVHRREQVYAAAHIMHGPHMQWLAVTDTRSSWCWAQGKAEVCEGKAATPLQASAFQKEATAGQPVVFFQGCHAYGTVDLRHETRFVAQCMSKACGLPVLS